MRICENCGFQNQDDYDFCAKCGKSLVGDAESPQVYVINAQPKLNGKVILLSYIVTIFLSWSGVVFSLISKNNRLGAFAFFGFFMPFYLLQAPVRELRKHGYIQMFISLMGVSLSFYLMFH